MLSLDYMLTLAVVHRISPNTGGAARAVPNAEACCRANETRRACRGCGVVACIGGRRRVEIIAGHDIARAGGTCESIARRFQKRYDPRNETCHEIARQQPNCLTSAENSRAVVVGVAHASGLRAASVCVAGQGHDVGEPGE